MGNNFGMFTIYVDPLNLEHENYIVRFVRAFENRVLPWVTPKDKQAPRHPSVKDISILLLKHPSDKQ
jgi:predicted HAD superfamily phosphohydrolase YqeG